MSTVSRISSSRIACLFRLAGGVCFVAVIAGCGGSGVPQPRVVKYEYDPVKTVRAYLDGYILGVPVGSERELFPKFVEEIRKTDPDKAATVEAGLNAILKSPAAARVEAKKLLEQL